MSKEKVTTSAKKNLRKEVTDQLEKSLGKLKEQLGEKKFGARIKKAVKILTEGVEIASKEEASKKKTATPAKVKAKAAPKAAKPEKAAEADAAPEATVTKQPVKETKAAVKAKSK